MRDLLHDVRYGLRLMLRSPGITFLAVLALALGIGANTTVFSLVDALLLRPLPVVQEPGRLVLVGRTTKGEGFDTTTYPNYLDYRDRNDVFSGLVAYRDRPMSLSGSGATERVLGSLVSGNYFAVLGVGAHLGRVLAPQDEQTPGDHSVVVLSHGLWKRRFASDPAIVGKTLRLNGHSFTVVGVAAEGFLGIDIQTATDLWASIMMQPQLFPTPTPLLFERGAHWIEMFARLKPGVSIEQAQAQMGVLAAQLADAFPAANRDKGIRLERGIGMGPGARAGAWQVVQVLSAAVLIVLLIACANVANLLLARATARRREIGIRLAVGASRARLLRQLLTESVLFALLGGVGAVLVAYWSADLLLALLPRSSFARPLSLSPDLRVLAFTLFVSLFAALLCGLVPALQASRPRILPALHEASAGAGSQRSWFRNFLVVGQVALSLALLAGAALFVRTLRNYRAIEVGFDAERVLTMVMNLQIQGYDQERGQRFWQQLLERVSAVPGVESASLAETTPLRGSRSTRAFLVEGREGPDAGRVLIDFNTVSPAFFRTLGIPLLRGRDFTPSDRPGSPGAAVVNEALAAKLWPGENPVGKRIAFSRETGRAPWMEVVGLVANIKHQTLLEKTRPLLYVPLAQNYEPAMTLHLHTAGDPHALAGALRAAIHELDSELVVYGVFTLADFIGSALWQQRMSSNLTLLFGLLALLLAAVGLYGVLAWSVAQRTREIGVRMALGARPHQVVLLVARQGSRLVLLGVVIGLGAAAALTRLIASQLYNVSPADPASFAVAALLLAAVALVACYIPARRATRIDPILALRYE